MKNIVITGATSMIGVAIIDAYLKNSKDTIFAVVRPNGVKFKRIPKDDRIKVIECDVENYSTLPQLIGVRCDVFYHIAWSLTGAKRNENIYAQAVNVQYTLDALHTAAQLGCSKFIGAGSQAEYGKLDLDKISVNSPINPTQPYGIAKYAAGRLAMIEAKSIGISCLWVRIFSVYGKFDKDTSMISSAITRMSAGEKVSFTEGIQRWDYLYSEDAGNAFYLLGEKATGYKVYNLGSGKALQIKEYIQMIRNCIDPQLPIGLGEIPYTEDTVMNLCADICELQRDTGWSPQIDFEEGIRRTVSNRIAN